MAYGDSNALQIPGLVATGDLSSKQYYFVKMASTAGAVKVCAATTDHPIGVLQNDPTDGQPAEIVALGVTKVMCGSTAVTVGADIGWNAEGQANVRTAAGSRSAGTAIEASSADADIVSILLHGYWRR